MHSRPGTWSHHRGRPTRAGRRPAAPPGCGSARPPRPAAGGSGPRQPRLIGGRRLARDRPSRRVDRIEADRPAPAPRRALDDRLDATPGQRDLAGLPAGSPAHLGPRQRADRPREPRGPRRPASGRAAGWSASARAGPRRSPALAAPRIVIPGSSAMAAPPSAGANRNPERASPAIRPGVFRPSARSSSSPSARARPHIASGTSAPIATARQMAARSIVLARIVPFMETDSTPRGDRRARRGEARSPAARSEYAFTAHTIQGIVYAIVSGGRIRTAGLRRAA